MYLSVCLQRGMSHTPVRGNSYLLSRNPIPPHCQTVSLVSTLSHLPSDSPKMYQPSPVQTILAPIGSIHPSYLQSNIINTTNLQLLIQQVLWGMQGVFMRETHFYINRPEAVWVKYELMRQKCWCKQNRELYILEKSWVGGLVERIAQ